MTKKTAPISHLEALEIAQRVGRDAYGDIGAFQVVDTEEDDDHWSVAFRRMDALVDGEGQHFEVWIDKNSGEARLFKGR